MNTFWIDGPEGALAVEAVGWVGTPLLLLHGLGGNASHWNAVSRALRPHRVLTLDLRGHGRTRTRAGAPMDPASLAHDVIAVADGTQLDRFVLVAHGFGTAVALETAAQVPERLAGLVLVEPAREPLPTLDDAGTRDDPRLHDRLLKERAATPDDVLHDARLALTRWDPDAARARWTGPTLTLTADDPPFAGAGHWLPLTRPGKLADALRGWLTSVAGSR